jgi:hypothetical protein
MNKRKKKKSQGRSGGGERENKPSTCGSLLYLLYGTLRLEGLKVEVSLSKKLVRPHLSGKKVGVVVHTCHSSNGGKCKMGGL